MSFQECERICILIQNVFYVQYVLRIYKFIADKYYSHKVLQYYYYFHLMLSSAIIAGTYIKAINMKNEDEGMHYMHCDSALIE